VLEGTRPGADPLELWRRWHDATFEAWANFLPGGGEGARTDPFTPYRRLFEGLQQEDAVGPEDLYETWLSWTQATFRTWQRAVETGARFAELAAPRYVEAAGEVQKQMLNGEEGFPTDPMDFYKRLYNAMSGPFAKLADDVLRDEAYLEISKRSLDYYSVLEGIFRRSSEQFFGHLRLPTVSDTTQMAGLIVGLDDRADRVEEMLEDFEERLERVEERLEGLDRIEDKLDRLLATTSEDSA
jgi:hypothetical protein